MSAHPGVSWGDGIGPGQSQCARLLGYIIHLIRASLDLGRVARKGGLRNYRLKLNPAAGPWPAKGGV
jgi:hypothetical protein